MSIDPGFREKINKLIDIKFQETLDGCVDCLSIGDLCDAHERVGVDLILHPKAYADELKKSGPLPLKPL